MPFILPEPVRELAQGPHGEDVSMTKAVRPGRGSELHS
jgi:hypothetical protein